MILTNGTKPLSDDNRLLVSYNIKNGSVIFSTRRCYGGQWLREVSEDNYSDELHMIVARIKRTVLATQTALAQKRRNFQILNSESKKLFIFEETIDVEVNANHFL